MLHQDGRVEIGPTDGKCGERKSSFGCLESTDVLYWGKKEAYAPIVTDEIICMIRYERGLAKYNEVMKFIATNHRNPIEDSEGRYETNQWYTREFHKIGKKYWSKEF